MRMRGLCGAYSARHAGYSAGYAFIIVVVQWHDSLTLLPRCSLRFVVTW